jgi:putative two-component system response regulator
MRKRDFLKTHMDEDMAVARLTEIFALACGYSPDEAGELRIAAALHDVGKRQIPRRLLLKRGKLTAKEFEIMKSHTMIGFDMVSHIQGTLGKKACVICVAHHERWDGEGYFRIPGDRLPDYVQMVSICDVAVALLNERPYKHRWPPAEVLGYIKEQAGKQFHPGLVKIFLSLAAHDKRVRAIFDSPGAYFFEKGEYHGTV